MSDALVKNKLLINGHIFDDSNINGNVLCEIKCHLNGNLINESLAIDSMNAVVRDFSTQPFLVAANNMLVAADGLLAGASMSTDRIDQTYKYGDIAFCYHEDNMIGKFRIDSVKRTGKYEYKLACISDVGLLATSYHYGGLYTGQPVSSVLFDIIGNIIPYKLDESLASVPVYGLLRKKTRRDNLRDLLFAIGGQLGKDSDGTLTISPMIEKTPYEIATEKFYQSGSATDGTPATEVRITEHSFIALGTDSEEVLYDGESAAEDMITPLGVSVVGILVEFQEPMHDLMISNATIIESGVNYAVISGSPHAKLIGKKYSHTERILSRRDSENKNAPNVIVSNACMLVNLMNSENVVDRLWNYYSSAQTVKCGMVLSTQKVGDNVRFKNVFDEITTGYIANMDLTLSSIVKAETTIIANCNPSGSGNYYQHVAIISESGEWIVPAECKGKIRAVIIGGGDGGQMGSPGEPGVKASGSSYGAGGKGGAPGAAGSGGKIFVITTTATVGSVLKIHVGAGGTGQTTDADATLGEASTLGDYSSEDGLTSDSGVSNILDGAIYAIPGEDGVAGGSGRGTEDENETVEYDGVIYVPGADGTSETSGSYYGYGGRGGGAAAGADGGAGENGFVNSQPFANGGKGGAGATPVKAKNGAVFGQGGGGGHGGGGGGGGGSAKGPSDSYTWYGAGGNAGSGGEGGDGAKGAVLIYY